MERIDLAKTINEATATFCQNRIGDKPPISFTVAAISPGIPWPDRKLQELVKGFIYETLLTNDPGAQLTVLLRRRPQLKDLSEFIGVQPSYWLHLRVSGRGVRLSESFIDEFFNNIGYRCAEWGRRCRGGNTPGYIHSSRYAGDQNGFLPGGWPLQA